jgi:hypothetical protein
MTKEQLAQAAKNVAALKKHNVKINLPTAVKNVLAQAVAPTKK